MHFMHLTFLVIHKKSTI
ncbi:hypothetical protein, partial [Plasmodium yoelii yoelii]